jgi:hypothetical protein
MTIGKVIGFVIGTVLFGMGARIGEMCFQKAEENIKNVFKPEDKEEGKSEIEAAVASALPETVLSGV